MKYLIIGTAGHVDHGKSALIKALTGTDTDRLKEEKLRGISIDLGFASLDLADDLRAGIVDVPGHERFLKNMLAGTGGIDMAMLVVAADEGVMPQTREHLAMLNLYGIQQGIVAINKIDKVDDEWLELVEEEVKAALVGTFLAEASLCRVSAVTGEGLDRLRSVLLTVARRVPVRDSKAPFRLWIDRAFTVKGYGVVVTGSVLSGSLKIGDSLTLYPGGSQVRIRGLETHGHKADMVIAGQRAAINLAGVNHDEISRGMVLAVSDRGQLSAEWDIVVDWQEEIQSGTRIRLHLGTGEYLGRIYNFKDANSKYMRLLLEAPLWAAAGDKGILRLYSPQHLIGGAMLIAPGSNSRKLSHSRGALADALYCGDWIEAVFQALSEAKQPITKSVILQYSGFIRDSQVTDSLKKLTDSGRIIIISGYYMTIDNLDALTNTMQKIIAQYHANHPDKPGLSREMVRQKLSISDSKPFDVLAKYWAETGILASDGADLALKSHAEQHGGWEHSLVTEAEKALEGIGVVNIDEDLLTKKLGVKATNARAVREALTRQGVLIRIADMHVYRKTIQYILGLVKQHFVVKNTITVAELRDMLNTSRKVALPILEYLDMNKYTVRDGDVRRPAQRLLDFSE